MHINVKLIFSIIGSLLMVLAGFMVIPAVVSWFMRESACVYFAISSIITLVVGLASYLSCQNHRKDVSKRDSYIIVFLVWISFTLMGMLPYVIGGVMPVVDALFESMSGFTTTGATVLPNIDSQPMGVLLWRSLTQWIGGMGIITLSAVLLPMLGIGGMQMFVAEGSMNRSDRIHPKINELARYSWIFYIAFTILEAGLLLMADMPVFDAVCHALTTMSTGGFSTHSDSIAYFGSPLIEYVVILFMFLGGVNFTLYYSMATGLFGRVVKDAELRLYVIIIVLSTFMISSLMLATDFITESEAAIRKALFHVVSVITSTGYTTDDYTVWPAITSTITVSLLICGACTGSTAGAIKLMRLIVAFRNIVGEFKRIVHPTAIVPVKYNGKIIAASDVNSVMLFVIFYFVVLVMGIAAIAMTGLNFEDSVGLAATALGDVGISVGNYGPLGDWIGLSAYTKIILVILMIIGRLEIFTVLLVFAPSFWRR